MPFAVPALPSLTAPVAGQTFARGATVPIAWTAAAGTAYYDIYFLARDGSQAWLFHDLPVASATSEITPAIAYTGPARVTLKAIGAMATGDQGATFLTPGAQASAEVTFSP